jgi:heme exporter protein CcmD
MTLDLQNAQAVYVLTAYGVAFTGLLGLLLASWRAARKRRRDSR